MMTTYQQSFVITFQKLHLRHRTKTSQPSCHSFLCTDKGQGQQPIPMVKHATMLSDFLFSLPCTQVNIISNAFGQYHSPSTPTDITIP